MTSSLIQFLIAAAVIVTAGALLTQCGNIIAHRTRLGGLLVGTILIAGATSLPELGVNINAVRLGSVDMALGDLIGSSLLNLLILAVLDLTRYSHGRMLSKGPASLAIAAGTSIALTAIVAIFIHVGPMLESVQVLRVGPGPLVLLAAYAMGVRLIYRSRREASSKPEEHTTWFPGLGELKLRGAITGYVIAALFILLAAPVLARAASDLAERSALGGTFFGSTFVALCTSLPEMVTTFAAVRMKTFDLAVGNILGSNCFNMVLTLPLDVVHEGSLLSSVASTHVYTALCVIVVTSVVILGQLYRVERKKPIYEPDALLAIILILAALTGLYFSIP